MGTLQIPGHEPCDWPRVTAGTCAISAAMRAYAHRTTDHAPRSARAGMTRGRVPGPLFTHGLAQQHPWCDVPHADECVRLALNSPASNGAAEFAARPLSVSTGLLFFLQPWLRLYFEIPVVGVNRHEEVMQEAF